MCVKSAKRQHGDSQDMYLFVSADEVS